MRGTTGRRCSSWPAWGPAGGRQPAPVVPAYADPAGVAVLRKVNRQAEAPLAPETIDLLTSDREATALPVAATDALAPMVDRWQHALAEGGHDLRGDLASLLDGDQDVAPPGPRDQLGVAIDVLADALAENTRLRAVVADLDSERERLSRKRRKLKRRLKRVVGPAPG